MIEHAPQRLIGVLGGMGPAATVDFMAKVIAATPAVADQDHVPLIVYQVPQIPSRTEAIAIGSDEPLAAMLAGIRVLETAGAEIVVIPCNTAHHWYESLASATPLEILHIADAVWAVLQERGQAARRVALMATRATLASRIFERRLLGVSFASPSEATQVLIDQTIAAIKTADLESARRMVRAAAAQCLDEGAEVLLLACTELPVALGTANEFDCIDATDALARACVAASFGRPVGSGARAATDG